MRKMLLATVALSVPLAACGQTAGNINTNNGSSLTSVTATAQGWTGGAGTIDVYSYNMSSTVPSKHKVASTSISDKGTFTLKLPDKATMQPVLSAVKDAFTPPSGTVCATKPTFSDANAQIAAIDQMEIMQTGTVVGFVDPVVFDKANNTVEGYAYLYSDRSLTIKGTDDCTYNGGSVINDRNVHTFDLSLVSGWNVLHIKASFSDKLTSQTFTSTSKTDFAWYAFSAQ